MKKKNKRDDLISLIDSQAVNILDVGCGNGEIGRILKDGGANVVGIESNEEMYLEASHKLSKVFFVDTENFSPPYSEGYFDCILYADVIEHLKDPLSVLVSYKKYLNNNGYVVASIPNVRYYKLIARLFFGGTWDYVESGILDRSHLRFFAFINILEIFEEAGYEVIQIKRNIVSSRFFRVLNRVLFNSLKDFLTYQYYVKAKKSYQNSGKQQKRKKIQF